MGAEAGAGASLKSTVLGASLSNGETCGSAPCFFQAQLVVLSAQIAWSENVENALSNVGGGGDAAPLHSVLSNVEVTLNVLADSVLMEQPPLRRRKLEHLVSAGRTPPHLLALTLSTRVVRGGHT